MWLTVNVSVWFLSQVITCECQSLTLCVCVCRMPSLSEQLQEVRSRAEVCLYSGGRVVEVRAGVMAMANLPLPPCSKYHHIAAETMVIENSFGSNRKEVRENKCTHIHPGRDQSWVNPDCGLLLANSKIKYMLDLLCYNCCHWQQHCSVCRLLTTDVRIVYLCYSSVASPEKHEQLRVFQIKCAFTDNDFVLRLSQFHKTNLQPCSQLQFCTVSSWHVVRKLWPSQLHGLLN